MTGRPGEEWALFCAGRCGSDSVAHPPGSSELHTLGRGTNWQGAHPRISAHTRWLDIWLSSVGATHPAPRRTPLWGFCSKPRCTVDLLAVPPEFLGFWLPSEVIRVELLVTRTCSGSGKIPDMCVLCVWTKGRVCAGKEGGYGRGSLFSLLSKFP